MGIFQEKDSKYLLAEWHFKDFRRHHAYSWYQYWCCNFGHAHYDRAFWIFWNPWDHGCMLAVHVLDCNAYT